MKIAIIGGFISLVGSVLLAAFGISASLMYNGWSNGNRFLSAIKSADVSIAFWFSVVLIVFGIGIMFSGLWKEE